MSSVLDFIQDVVLMLPYLNLFVWLLAFAIVDVAISLVIRLIKGR